MTAPIPFSPLAWVTAAENVASYVARARNRLTAFGADLDFDSDQWDITKHYAATGYRDSRQGRKHLLFSHPEKRGRRSMSDGTRDLAKSYVRSELAGSSSSDLERAICCFRAIDDAMQALSVEHIWDCDIGVLNKAVDLMVQRVKAKSVDTYGPKLGIIARFLSENGLTRYPLESWKYTRQERQSYGRIGGEFERRRQESLPDPKALDALAEAFRVATEPRDVLVTSASAILCAAPERINEVLFLREACEVEQSGEDGKPYLGLRWAGSKGYDDHVKLVLPVMADVVRSALSKIRVVTAGSRKMAAWYEQHPDRLYLPEDMEHLRKSELLDLEDIAILVGVSKKRGDVRRWLIDSKVPITTTSRPCSRRPVLAVRFDDFQAHILSLLPVGFPLCDARSGMPYSKSLFVMPRGLFGVGQPWRCMFESVRYHHIGCALGQSATSGSITVFRRVGLDPDGRLFIRSHQFRHYLNTLAQGAHLSQVDIAKWSGRANVYQNTAYDHVSSEEIITQIREAVGDHAKAIGPLAEIPKNLPVSRAEFAEMVVPTAHITLYGFCIHDYTTAPCEMFRQCLDCREHVCVKGLPDKTARVRHALAATRAKLEKTIRAMADGVFGAEEWVETHQAAEARLENLLAILEDPNIADGAIVQLTATNTHSLSEGAVLDRLRLDEPSTAALASPSQNKALT